MDIESADVAVYFDFDIDSETAEDAADRLYSLIAAAGADNVTAIADTQESPNEPAEASATKDGADAAVEASTKALPYVCDRLTQLSADELKSILINELIKQLKQQQESLPADQKQQLQGLLADPGKLEKLAAARLQKILVNAAETSALPNKDELKAKVSAGEVPVELVKLLINKENEATSQIRFTGALHESLAKRVQDKFNQTVAMYALIGAEPPEGCPVALDKGNDGQPKFSLDNFKKSRQINDLATLEALEKWISKAAPGKESGAIKAILSGRLAALPATDIFEQIKTQIRACIIRESKDATLSDEELEKRTSERLELLAKMFTAGATEEEQVMADLKTGKISPALASKLLEAESRTGDIGAVAVALLIALEQHYNNEVGRIRQSYPNDLKPLPAKDPFDGAARFENGISSKAEVEPADVAAFIRKLSRVEEWLNEARLRKNPDIEQLHMVLAQSSSVLDRKALYEQLKANEAASLRHRDAVLSNEEQAIYNADRSEAKIQQLAANRVQQMLLRELDKAIKAGTLPSDSREQLTAMIEKGIPDQLLQVMLQTEINANTFGPVTKAMYFALNSMLESDVPTYYAALVDSSLPIPVDCPIKLVMGENGQPETQQALAARIRSGSYKADFGFDSKTIPSETKLLEVIRAVRWSREAAKHVSDYTQAFQEKCIAKLYVELNRPGWERRAGEDRELWISRVAPYIDLAGKMKVCTQALCWAEKHQGGTFPFDREALRKEFPGTVQFDKDGRVISIKLDLPTTLDSTLENRQKIERIDAWLAKYEKVAKQIADELLKVSKDSNRIFIWGDFPGKSNDGRDYNLSRFRVRTEEVNGKVRVYSEVARYQTGVLNYQNLFLGDPVAVDRCEVPDPLQDKEGLTSEQRDKLPKVPFVEFNPTDLVVVVEDDKIRLIMAKDIGAWAAKQERKQDIEKGVSIALDVGMVLSGAVHLRNALKARALVAGMSAAAVTAEMKAVVRQELMAAGKSFILGGSGFALNNAAVESSEWGRRVLMFRHLVFIVDGVRSLGQLGRDGGAWGLRKIGAISKPAVTAEKTALEAFRASVIQWQAPSSTIGKIFYAPARVIAGPYGVNHWSMLAGEGVLGVSMASKLGHRPSDGNYQKEANEAALDLSPLVLNKDTAARYLRNAADAMIAIDPAAAKDLKPTVEFIAAAEQMTGVWRATRVADMSARYMFARNDNEKLLLAVGLLRLLKNPDGSLPDNINVAPPVSTADVLKFLEKCAVSGSPTLKLVAAQTLVCFGQMQIQEYASVCKNVLSDQAAPEDIRIQAVIGLGIAIHAEEAAATGIETTQQRLTRETSSFAVSPKELGQALAKAATDSNNPNVRAMAAAVYQSVTNPNVQESERLFGIAVGTWRLHKLRAQKIQNSGADGELEQEIFAIQQSVSLLQRPELSSKLAQQAAAREQEKDRLVLQMLDNAQKLQSFEQGLKKQGIKNDETAELQKQLQQIREEQQQLAGKLKELQDEKRVTLSAEDLAQPSQRLDNDLLRAAMDDLRAPVPADNQARLAADEKRLAALDLLERVKAPGLIHPDELREALVSLVKMENGLVAVEALKKLQPYLNHLSEEQRRKINQSINDLLNASHNPVKGTSGNVERAAAAAKEELLRLFTNPGTAEAFRSAFIGNYAEREAFMNNVASLLDMKDVNNFAAERYPELGKLACDTLSLFGYGSDNVCRVLADRMNAEKEPNAAIRLASYKALRALNPALVAEQVGRLKLAERDPAVQQEYANLEFSGLRPNRPECAIAIYEAETAFWEAVFQEAPRTVPPEELNKVVLEKYELLHPDRYKAVTAEEEEKKDSKIEAARKKGTILWGKVQFNPSSSQPRLEAAAAAVDAFRAATVEKEDAQWKQLLVDAQQDNESGHRARMILLKLATHATFTPENKDAQLSNRQQAAITEIFNLIKNDCPGKERLFFSLMGAWNCDNTPKTLYAREQFLQLIGDLLNRKPPHISPQIAGRLLHGMLDSETAPGKINANSRTDDAYSKRVIKIIQLMDAAGYPLAMAKIQEMTRTENLRQDVRAEAYRFFDKLLKTAPTSFDRLDVRTANLEKAVAARATTRAAQDELKGKPVEEVAKRAADLEMDGLRTRKAIYEACAQEPIKNGNDPRVPYLLKLLNDPDDGVAMIAAWFIVNSANPLYCSDSSLRIALINQPFFQTAIQKLQQISNRNDLVGHAAVWKNDAAKYIETIKKWSIPVPQVVTDQSPAAQAIKEAAAVLDGTKTGQTLEDKKDAISALVRLGASAYFAGKTNLYNEAAKALWIAAATNAELGGAAYEALTKLNEQFAASESFSRNGATRILEWPNRTRTEITTKGNTQTFRYPNNTWFVITYDDAGKVIAYEGGQGVQRVGTNFAPGSVNVSRDGTISIDNNNGVRSVIRPSGDIWSFKRKENDNAKIAQSQTEEFNREGVSTEAKVKLIESITDCATISGAPIVRGDDPRLTLLVTALSNTDKEITLAAARTLLHPENKNIDQELMKRARKLYLTEQLLAESNGFIRPGVSDRVILQDMHESIALLGSIKPGDARIDLFKTALNHESRAVRLQAARIIATASNTGFSREDKLQAFKAASVEAEDSFRNCDADRSYDTAIDIMRVAAKELGSFDYKNSAGTTVTFKDGNVSSIKNSAGNPVSFEYDANGIKSIKGHDLPFEKSSFTRGSTQNGEYIWYSDSTSWLGQFRVAPDGSWGYTGSYFRTHTGYDGSVWTPYERGCYWHLGTGGSLYLDKAGNVTGYGRDGVLLNVEPIPNSDRVIIKFPKGGQRELRRGEFTVDASGTLITTDRQTGLLVGEMFHGGKIEFNQAKLPITVIRDNTRITINYKPCTNLVESLSDEYGNEFKRTATGWQQRKAGDSEFREWKGEISVCANGEYIVVENGIKSIHHLDGSVESFYADGSAIGRVNGEIAYISRPDGTTDYFSRGKRIEYRVFKDEEGFVHAMPLPAKRIITGVKVIKADKGVTFEASIPEIMHTSQIKTRRLENGTVGPEARTASIYMRVLDRYPDYPGCLGWQKMLTTGASFKDVVKAITKEPEFRNSIPKDKAEVVPFLYARLLDRDFEPGKDGDFAELLEKEGVDAVIAKILDSKEFDELTPLPSPPRFTWKVSVGGLASDNAMEVIVDDENGSVTYVHADKVITHDRTGKVTEKPRGK